MDKDDRPQSWLVSAPSNNEDPELRDAFWSLVMKSYHAFDVNAMGRWADEIDEIASRSDPSIRECLRYALEINDDDGWGGWSD